MISTFFTDKMENCKWILIFQTASTDAICYDVHTFFFFFPTPIKLMTLDAMFIASQYIVLLFETVFGRVFTSLLMHFNMRMACPFILAKSFNGA